MHGLSWGVFGGLSESLPSGVILGTGLAPRSSSASSLVALTPPPGPAVVPATEIVEALEPNFDKILPIATLKVGRHPMKISMLIPEWLHL